MEVKRVDEALGWSFHAGPQESRFIRSGDQVWASLSRPVYEKGNSVLAVILVTALWRTAMPRNQSPAQSNPVPLVAVQGQVSLKQAVEGNTLTEDAVAGMLGVCD